MVDAILSYGVSTIQSAAIDNLSSKGISYFTHKNLDVSYFIALEPESTYNA